MLCASLIVTFALHQPDEVTFPEFLSLIRRAYEHAIEAFIAWYGSDTETRNRWPQSGWKRAQSPEDGELACTESCTYRVIILDDEHCARACRRH